jgi:hypothetical protein
MVMLKNLQEAISNSKVTPRLPLHPLLESTTYHVSFRKYFAISCLQASTVESFTYGWLRPNFQDMLKSAAHNGIS